MEGRVTFPPAAQADPLTLHPRHYSTQITLYTSHPPYKPSTAQSTKISCLSTKKPTKVRAIYNRSINLEATHHTNNFTSEHHNQQPPHKPPYSKPLTTQTIHDPSHPQYQPPTIQAALHTYYLEFNPSTKHTPRIKKTSHFTSKHTTQATHTPSHPHSKPSTLQAILTLRATTILSHSYRSAVLKMVLCVTYIWLSELSHVGDAFL